MARSNHVNTKLLDTTNGAISVTSASFTPQANSLLVVDINCLANVASGTIDTANSTLAGGSLAWTKRTSANSGAMGFNYSQCVEQWTAPVGGSPSSMTLNWQNTYNAASSSDAVRVAVQAVSHTGYDTGSPIGAIASDATLGTSGTGAMTLSGAPASSSIVHAMRGVTQDGTTDITATADTSDGFSEVYDNPTVSGSEGYTCMQSQERTGSTSTGVAWDEINVEAVAVFGEALGLAIEIKMAAAPAGDLPPLTMPTMRPPMRSR